MVVSSVHHWFWLWLWLCRWCWLSGSSDRSRQVIYLNAVKHFEYLVRLVEVVVHFLKTMLLAHHSSSSSQPIVWERWARPFEKRDLPILTRNHSFMMCSMRALLGVPASKQ